MSDPRTDFFSSDAAATSADPRGAFFATGDTDISQAAQTIPPSTGIQHLTDVARTAVRHPLTSVVGLGENVLSGITGGAGNLADVATGSEYGTHNWAYRPRTEAGREFSAEAGRETQAISSGYDTVFGTSPIAQQRKKELAGTVGAAGTIYGITGAAEGIAARARSTPPSIEEGHPLTGAAQAEEARIEGHRQAAQDAGVPITDRVVSPGQRFIDGNAADDLQLPKNSPITSNVIDAAQRKYVDPGYNNARAVPEYQLGPKYQAAIKDVDLSQIDPKWRPPADGSMTGQQAVDLSQQLRSQARGLFGDAENQNLTFAQRESSRAAAQAHYNAAKAVEAGFREGSGNAAAADAWDAARVYKAKSEMYRSALDGGGHVIGPKLKRQLGDDPSSPQQERIASVVATDPEQFRSTRLQTPQEGAIKRSTRALAPVLGAGVGSVVMPGHLGAAGGAALGELAAEKLLGPSR